MKHQQLLTEGLVFFYVDNLHYEKFADGTTKEVEVPFEIPESWEWVRLSTLSSKIQYGYTASAQDNGNAKLLRITDIQNNKVEWSTVPYCDISEDKLENMKLIDNDILIARTGGTIGKSFLIRNVSDISVFASYLIRVQVTIGNLSDFVKKFIESPNYWSQLQEMSVGTGQPNVNATNLSTLLIPLPPFQEQQRIIDEINLGLVELRNIDKNQSDLKSLATQLKQKVLDVAMKGKLVPQDPNDEPASVLLEKIRAEKQKLFEEGKLKKKDLEEITVVKGDDNAYYGNIPNSWILTKFNNVAIIARGGSPRPIKSYLTDDILGINWIKIGDTEKGEKYIYSTSEKIDSSGIAKTRLVKSGDFLLSNSMSFGRPYILKIDGAIHDGWLMISDFQSFYSSDFLYWLLSSEVINRQFRDAASGTAVKNLNSDKVAQTIVPILNLKEQIKISRKIDTVNKLIESVKREAYQ